MTTYKKAEKLGQLNKLVAAIDGDKQCIKCEEYWPNDTEFFFADDSYMCIACEKETKGKKSRPLSSILTLAPHEFEYQIAVCRAARFLALRGLRHDDD